VGAWPKEDSCLAKRRLLPRLRTNVSSSGKIPPLALLHQHHPVSRRRNCNDDWKVVLRLGKRVDDIPRIMEA
jgi:hypothetical protein